MGNILYTIFIFPIEQIMELSYLFIFRICNSPTLSILGVSFAVSIFTLPLYFMAEKHQRTERDIQSRMKPKVEKIKSVFSGNEQFMILSTYYRQNGYHPLYSLRSSISLIIQIPFFIAAYHFLLNLAMIQGVSFGPIHDMARPDALFSIKNIPINILPIIMTVVNCAAAVIYLKGLSSKEKIQLYGMALIFLILLYNSPSGMVLYWTGNNIFSLVKNALQKAKHPKRIIFVLVSIFCLLLDIYILFFHKGWIVKRIGLALILASIPILSIMFANMFKGKSAEIIFQEDDRRRNIGIFVLSLFVLFLLSGFVIPSSLIASSVHEFSFIDNYKSPSPFIVNTLLQSIGTFLVLPLCIYWLVPRNIKHLFGKILAVIAFIAIINVFLFPGSYGHLTVMFDFSENTKTGITINVLNLLVNIAAAILILFFISRGRKLMIPALTIICLAFVTLGTIKAVKIHNDFRSLQSQLAFEETKTAGYEPIYQFSKTGKNVLIIMLDTGLSGYVPHIFEEKPALNNSFDGFTWYKNTISFGGHTNFGVPGIYGGYEYTPLEMQAKNNIPLVEKHNEALLLLPRIFSEHDFTVTITNPPYANYKWIPDLTIFKDYPLIKADNIIGKYTGQWLARENQLEPGKVSQIVERNLIRFSFFKFAPQLFRNYLYDHGKWLTTQESTSIKKATLDNYVFLDVLPEITAITETQSNYCNILTSDLPHEPYLLQVPDYIPSNNITDNGNGPFAGVDRYHVNIASYLLMGKWFDFLKYHNVYNNTRIIIVSDHGIFSMRSPFLDNVNLPNGETIHNYTSLLLVKDFNSHGPLLVDDMFMTNADVPLIALEGLVENPVNPQTGKVLESDKANGVTITTSHILDIEKHPKYIYNIKQNEWLHVHTNIYDPENWSSVSK